MRVMVLVKANEDSERGDYSGHEEEFAAMGKYNEELLKSGIMLAGEGLTPSSDGKRVAFGEDGAAR
ncbi:MAG TPA: YciI family protein, partial [Trebonia sp.]|nr:YciI family protein [Trebonia sp.]